MIGTIPVSYFCGWQQIWKLPRITLHAGTHTYDKCKNTSYSPYRYKEPTSMKSSHYIQLNVKYSRSHVYPDYPNIRIMYLIYNRLVNHNSDCPEISQINKVGEKYARFCGHDTFFLTATTKPSQAMFIVGTLNDRCHAAPSYTSHANKVQCAACSHGTCRCVWGCCKVRPCL